MRDWHRNGQQHYEIMQGIELLSGKIVVYCQSCQLEPIIEVSALTPEDPQNLSIRDGIILPTEKIVCAYKGIRDMLILTDKRILCIDKQGITGKKQKYLSIPVAKVNAFSVETGGTLDFDCDINIYVSGMGFVHAEIMRPTKNIDSLVEALNKLLF